MRDRPSQSRKTRAESNEGADNEQEIDAAAGAKRARPTKEWVPKAARGGGRPRGATRESSPYERSARSGGNHITVGDMEAAVGASQRQTYLQVGSGPLKVYHARSIMTATATTALAILSCEWNLTRRSEAMLPCLPTHVDVMPTTEHTPDTPSVVLTGVQRLAPELIMHMIILRDDGRIGGSTLTYDPPPGGENPMGDSCFKIKYHKEVNPNLHYDEV